MEQTTLAYAAGFFDGEGCISILKRTRTYKNTTTIYFLRLSIGQKDGATLDWIKENFGGTVHPVRRDGSWVWVATDNLAHQFLKRIISYLKYKRPQAELALRFYEERPGGHKLLTQEELARRETLFREMKRLKQVFTPSRSTGATTERVNVLIDDVTV